MSAVERLDRLQRRYPPLGLPIAVIYKFADDQSSYLAAIVTHYSFVSLFPLLLISSSLLGFVLAGDPHLAHLILTSALAQFPIVGSQLKSPTGLQGSAVAVVVGALVSLYGVLGLGQAIQNMVHVAWATPRNSRPNPFLSRLLSALLVLGVGTFALAVSASSLVGQSLRSSLPHYATLLSVTSQLWSVVLFTLAVSFLFRLSAPRAVERRHALAGALVVGVGFWLLQQLGGLYVQHILSKVSDVNAVFALTLGLSGLLYLGSTVLAFGLQVTVVLTRHLHPRALLTPFTDDVSLTEADRRTYTAYARAQRHKGFEEIEVSFEGHDDATTGATPAPPASEPSDQTSE